MNYIEPTIYHCSRCGVELSRNRWGVVTELDNFEIRHSPCPRLAQDFPKEPDIKQCWCGGIVYLYQTGIKTDWPEGERMHRCSQPRAPKVQPPALLPPKEKKQEEDPARWSTSSAYPDV